MLVQYKCPQCGSNMEFDTASGDLHCASCGNNIKIEDTIAQEYKEDYAKQHGGEYDQDEAEKNINEVTGDFREIQKETSDRVFEEEDKVFRYYCENCGAELVVTDDTTATKCSFCDSPMIIRDRMQGKRAPAKVIPFRISRDEAVAGFKKWCKRGLITPNDFMSADKIADITGIYIPFWIYDMAGQGEAEAHCTRVYSYTSGNYHVTATKHYKVWRKVDLDYDRIPVDASKRMDDELMDKLEPFNYEDIKDFSAMYLPGFIAEGYNYTDEDLLPRVRTRVTEYMDQYIRETIHGYATVSITNHDYHIKEKRADYALLPVWMVNYNYRDGQYLFAMNGDTGKIVGKPPISKYKMAAWFLGSGGILFLILRLIVIFLVGGDIG